MAKTALYRKYRSQTFSDLVGQEHVVRTLRHALAQGSTAQAFLFTGPRGTGKTTAARLLAKGLNCTNLNEGEPCGECDACVEIANGSFLDVVEMDAASEAGVEDVREHIVQASEYQPVIGRYRVFIIDEVHDLSAKAFDSLLKTIEEPPPHAVFVLATTEFNKVPPTIRSRCQRYEFHRGSMTQLIQRLRHVTEAEGVEAEPEALTAIAKMADGGYRDALTLLEQALVSAVGPLTRAHVEEQLGLVADDRADALLQAIAASEPAKIMEMVEEIYRRGYDPRSLLEALLFRLSDLTRASYGVDSGGDPALEAHAKALADSLGRDRMLGLRSSLATAHKVIRDISLPRIWLEAELIRLSMPTPAAAAPTPMPAAAPAARAPAPRPAEKPAPRKPVDASSPEGVWADIFDEFTRLSKLAKARLPGSQVVSSTGGTIVIGLPLATNVRWASEKLAKAVQEAWAKRTGETPIVKFELLAGDSAARSEEEDAPPVELPLEGQRLVDEVQRTFQPDRPKDSE